MDSHDYLPGTRSIIEDEGPNSTHLQKHGDIILSPQPTNSVNDPLRWSAPRKYWHVFLVCFVTGLTAATSNDAGSAGYGVLFIGIGYWTLLISPATWLYGRRITYLVCVALGLGGAIWFARIRTARDSIWNQLFVGASEAVAEANVQLSLSDLFFQHQRGTMLGIYVLATSIGTYLGPLIGSYIADSSLGWRWIGWWSVIISGATLIVLYFALEETAFDRPRFDREGTEGIRPIPSLGQTSITAQSRDDNEKAVDFVSADRISSAEADLSTELPKTYWQRIALITPAPNLKGYGFRQYLARLWHTLRVFSFPPVLFAGLQWGAQDAWLTFYLTVEEDNWYGPPWNYSDAAVGIMNVPCLIGAVIGCYYGGVLSDYFVIWMAKRNGGIQEAEHRLWFLYLAAIISPIGMLLFGIGSGQGWSWPRPYIGLAFIGFGWGCAGDLSMAYLVDCYPEMVLEGMVGVAVINNSLGCIFTFTASDWLASAGIQNTFIVIAVLDFLFIMVTVPMMIFGKRCRRFTKQSYLNFVRIRDAL